MAFNFRQPNIEKTDKRPPNKFQEVVQKISAGLGLLQIGGGSVLPKVSEKVISVILIFIIYIFCAGLYITGSWFIQLLKYIF